MKKSTHGTRCELQTTEASTSDSLSKVPKLAPVITIPEGTTVRDAYRVCDMNKEFFGLVLDKDDSAAGSFTSIDLVYRVIAGGLDPHTTFVHEVINRRPIVAQVSTSIDQAFAAMVSCKVSYLPVCDGDGNVLGVFHLRDVLHGFLRKQQRRLEASENLFKAVIAAQNEFGSDELHAQMRSSATKLLQKTSFPYLAAITVTQGSLVIVTSSDSVSQVARLMKEKCVSLACVVEGTGLSSEGNGASLRILGSCTSNDVAAHIMKFGFKASRDSVTRIMRAGIVSVNPSMNVYDVAKKMLKDDLSSIIVVDEYDRPLSVVSLFSIASSIHRLECNISETQSNAEDTFITSYTTPIFSQPPLVISRRREDYVGPDTEKGKHRVQKVMSAHHYQTNTDEHEALPEYTPDVEFCEHMPLNSLQTPSKPLGSHGEMLTLKMHHEVFKNSLSQYHSKSMILQPRLVVLDSTKLFEASTDLYDELLRRQNVWNDEYASPFLPLKSDFSSARNQARQRLSDISPSHFQLLVQGIYSELSRRYPVIQEDITIIAAHVARLSDIFKNVSQYRNLLLARESKAQHLLDLFQLLLHIPGLMPDFRRNLLVVTQRLSNSSGLFPACFDLKGVEPMGDYPVASGGFADIYKARFGRQIVCLKVIRIYQTSHIQSFFKRIFAEAILWGQLQHPNLLPFYGLYKFNSRLCLVSPWMDHDIMNFLDDHPDANRRLLVSDVASGVHFLHSQDIVHGDLKGANILVNKLQRATIADFGLSSISDPNIFHWSSNSTAASKGGSTRWQAPELFDVANDKLVHNTKTTDIYAFSCVAYEIFTEMLPFFELNLEATVMFRVKAGDRPSRPSALSPAWWPTRLTKPIWELMESCWHSESKARPSIETITAHAGFREPDMRPVIDTDVISPLQFRYSMTSCLPSATIYQELLRDLDN